jgi:NAD(P)-dependent dehydrogenase (short-subunit alcohol dehydrogenase family)
LKRVLLITGGSRGIGAATALLAAQDGWAVAVNYANNQAAANQVVQAIAQAGGQAIAVQMKRKSCECLPPSTNSSDA